MTKKIKIIFFLTLMFIMTFTVKINAVSISVSSSKSTVSPGQSFPITISGNDATGKVSISVSGGSASTSSVWVENNSQTITVTAGSSGTVNISVRGELSSSAGEDKTVSASTSVNIVQPSSGESSSNSGSSGTSTTKPNTSKPTTSTTAEKKPKSTDNTLSSLNVEEGAITPEFNKDVREYKLTVPNEIVNVNVVATPTDSKATTEVTGNVDLKEGENTVTVTVTAEDGSTSKYLIRVFRARVPLALKSLIVKYVNENGELRELPLNPKFAFDILEYTLEDIEYWVENISIEAIANIEGGTIDIQGADNLQIGENTITITLRIPVENSESVTEEEESKEETISYTIKVNKKEEPTLLAKISNWFKGIFGGVSSWYNNNQGRVILVALGICIIALLGLSIYIIADYNKYKDIIAKVKKTNEINANQNIAEEIYKKNNSNIFEDIGKKSDNNDNAKGGKHF